MGHHLETLVEMTGDRYPGEGMERKDVVSAAEGGEFLERSIGLLPVGIGLRAKDRSGAKMHY